MRAIEYIKNRWIHRKIYCVACQKWYEDQDIFPGDEYRDGPICFRCLFAQMLAEKEMDELLFRALANSPPSVVIKKSDVEAFRR